MTLAMCLTASPLVTVIMPCFNAGRYLAEAITSILGQTYKHWELLIVDDGSTDCAVADAEKQFADPRIRWFRQRNQGKPAAMNLALSATSGEYYVLQDADDTSYPTRLEYLVAEMNRHPEVAAVFSGYDLIINDQRCAPILRDKDVAQCSLDIAAMRMPSHDPTAIYRMSTVKSFDYDVSLPVVEGYDYVLRVGEAHPMRVVGQCLYSYRIHSTSITHSDPTRRDRMVMEVHRRACARRGMEFEAWWNNRHLAGLRRSRAYTADNELPSHFMKSVQDQCNSGKRFAAIGTALKCAWLGRFEREHLKPIVLAMCPLAVRSRFASYHY